MENKKKAIFYTLFVLLVTIIFGLVMFNEIKIGDYPQHIGWAKEYSQTGYLYKIPHTLFAKAVTIVRALLPANFFVRVSVFAKQVYDLKSYEISALIVMILSYIGAAIYLVKRILREWAGLKLKKLLWLAGAGALILLLFGPIFVFSFPKFMYLGYIVPNPYHNPTYILGRPFVLIMFFGIVDYLFSKWNWRKALIMVIVISCASLAKPSFTLTILPALGLTLLIFYWKELKKVNWFYLIIPIGMTAVVMLISEFIINYTGDRGEAIIVAPFQSMLYHVPNVPAILFRLLMSLIFPISVSIIYWKDLKSKFSFRLAWVNLIVAILMGYLFAEQINSPSNNFWWGTMFGLTIVLFETFVPWARKVITDIENKKKLTWQDIVISVELFLHLACGIIYFIYCFLDKALMVD
jgi:hypothetical protein